MRIDDVNISGNTIEGLNTNENIIIRKINVYEESSLPTSGNTIGDRVRYNNSEYVWNGNAWVEETQF